MTIMKELKVLEAYTRDVGRGIVRIDYATMEELNVNSGDIVKIMGKTDTVGKALPLYPSDEKKGIIRFDGLIRNNCAVAIGNTVMIEKQEYKIAEKVSVIPLESIPPIDERYLTDALEGVSMIVGDNVMVPYFGGRLTFQIKATIPIGAVLVSQKTIFDIINMTKSYRVYGAMNILAASPLDAEEQARKIMSNVFEVQLSKD